ncbi:MAG: hypothetical protein WC969_07230 [Elusimicrobiota bacterium]
MTRPRAWLSAGLLVAALLGAWAAFPGTGFYQDDWYTLEVSTRPATAREAVGWYAERGWHWRRPGQILVLPLSHRLVLGRPRLAAGILAGLSALEALMFFGLLRRMTGRPGAALAATAFLLLYPGRPSFNIWFADILQTAAHPMVLGGLWLYRDWLDSRRTARLLLGLLLFLAAGLCYEAAFFLPALLLADPAVLPWSGDPKARLRRAAAALGPLLPCALALLVWNQFLVARVFPAAARPASLALLPALKSLRIALECVSLRVLHDCARALGPAARGFSAWHWPLAALCALLTARLVGSGLEEQEAPLPRGWWFGVGAVFLGGYLPYAFSGGYEPVMHGIMSRTNAAGAWVFGMAAAGALCAWPPSRSKGRVWAVGAAAALLLCAQWTERLDWVRSWKLQERVLEDVRSWSSSVPGPATIVLSASLYAGRVVAFDAPYDFDSALHLALGRPDLRGAVYSWRLRFLPERAEEAPAGTADKEYAYARMYLYDVRSREFLRLKGPPDASWLKAHPERLVAL